MAKVTGGHAGATASAVIGKNMNSFTNNAHYRVVKTAFQAVAWASRTNNFGNRHGFLCEERGKERSYAGILLQETPQPFISGDMRQQQQQQQQAGQAMFFLYTPLPCMSISAFSDEW
jgi:hypothetical protein